MKAKTKVWFHRSRAVAWGFVGIASFVFNFTNSVMLVWIASLYANVVSDISAAEAADDRETIKLLKDIKAWQDNHVCCCKEMHEDAQRT